jgi:asparaginyl-tRNA synthetase
MNIKEIISSLPIGTTIQLNGWVRTFRNEQFIALNDGSCISNLQVVVNADSLSDEDSKRIHTGACISVHGTLTESLGKGQAIELTASKVEILGESNPNEFPIQMKKHSLEFQH